MAIEIHRLEASRRDDFYRLHSDTHGCGWCFCAAWWTPTWDGWSERSAEQNRALREGLFERGEHDGYLLYAEGEPAAWMQVGRRDRLPHLMSDYGLDPDPETWAVTCFLVAPGFRRRGMSRRMLAAALDDLERRGIRKVEAFPRRGDHLPPEDLWRGPEGLFLEAGFEIVREDARRPILRRTAGPD